jgi:hypothetical protein
LVLANLSEPGDRRAVFWDRVEAKVVDEIMISVVESDSCDPGKPFNADWARIVKFGLNQRKIRIAYGRE